MEDDESLQQCTKCSGALTNYGNGNNKSVLYCAACAEQGCGPLEMSGNRDTHSIDSTDSVELTELQPYDSHVMLPVVDIDDQTQTRKLSDMLQNLLHSSPELVGDSGPGSNLDVGSSRNFCSSVVSQSWEPGDGSGSELLGSKCMSTCRLQQSSVIRLRKQMEMLAQDEDIPVHRIIATEEEDAYCLVNKGEMKSTQRSSDSVALLSSSCFLRDVDDGLLIADMHQASKTKNLQQFDGSMSDVSSEMVLSFNSSKGNVVQDSC